jgi:hypothetical protein
MPTLAPIPATSSQSELKLLSDHRAAIRRQIAPGLHAPLGPADRGASASTSRRTTSSRTSRARPCLIEGVAIGAVEVQAIAIMQDVDLERDRADTHRRLRCRQGRPRGAEADGLGGSAATQGRAPPERNVPPARDAVLRLRQAGVLRHPPRPAHLRLRRRAALHGAVHPAAHPGPADRGPRPAPPGRRRGRGPRELGSRSTWPPDPTSRWPSSAPWTRGAES